MQLRCTRRTSPDGMNQQSSRTLMEATTSLAPADVLEAARANAVRASYVALGPIHETTCKSMRFGPQGPELASSPTSAAPA